MSNKLGRVVWFTAVVGLLGSIVFEFEPGMWVSGLIIAFVVVLNVLHLANQDDSALGWGLIAYSATRMAVEAAPNPQPSLAVLAAVIGVAANIDYVRRRNARVDRSSEPAPASCTA